MKSNDMIARYQLHTSIDVASAISIAEELRACSINAELIEGFNEELSTYDNFIIEVNLDGLDVCQAFKLGTIVEDIASYSIASMQEKRVTIVQHTNDVVNDGSNFQLPFTSQDFKEIQF